MSNWWMVRAGDGNELIPEWVSKGIVSIGWGELGNLLSVNGKDKLLHKADKVYKDEKPGTRQQWVSQVWRFSHDIVIGDKIITYEKESREYLVGKVTGKYEYNPTKIIDYPNVIKVSWKTKRISRDDMSQGAKNSLGGISTIFKVSQWGSEIEGLLSGSPTEEIIDEIVEFNDENFIQQAYSMVEDAVDKLDPWQMQDLVAGLLRAMSYQVKVSPKGPDGGVDILAHKDAFGFEQPIIKVQVKHKKAASSAPEIQQLLGANPIGANSLFVSTGGFTTSARTVAQQNRVKLLDLSELVEMINEWYESFPIETKSLLPLKKIYVPVK